MTVTDLLAHTDEGTGPAVLMLPGAAADRGIFVQSGLVAALSTDHRVIAVDWRGAGESPAMPPGHGFDDEVADLLTLLDHLGVDATHVLGVSHGTAAALLLAADHPERVESLVLASPWARTEPSMRLMFQAWRAVFSTGDRAAIGRAMVWWLFTPEFIDADLPRAEAIAAAIFDSADSPVPATHTAVAELNLTWDFADRLSEVLAPVLVLAAEDDRAIPETYSRAVAEALPDATFQAVTGPGAGHAYLLEAGPGPAAAAAAFVREVAAGSRPGRTGA